MRDDRTEFEKIFDIWMFILTVIMLMFLIMMFVSEAKNEKYDELSSEKIISGELLGDEK